MGLKATLTALIDANIRSKTPKVVKVEHADVEQAILDNGYITATENSIPQIYTTKNGSLSALNYNLQMTKSFGMITIDIEVQYTGSSNVSNGSTAFTWKTLVGGLANEFRCGGSGNIYRANLVHDLRIVQSVFARIDQTGMTLPQGLTAGAKYYGQITFPSFS